MEKWWGLGIPGGDVACGQFEESGLWVVSPGGCKLFGCGNCVIGGVPSNDEKTVDSLCFFSFIFPVFCCCWVRL